MKDFTELHQALEGSPFHRSRAERLARYFREAAHEDAAWTLYFLFGGQLKRTVPGASLKQWILEEGNLPLWLVEQCAEQVKDLAETMALLAELLPRAPATAPALPLHAWITERLLPLQAQSPEKQREAILGWWRTLPLSETSMLNHLLTGRFQTPAPRRTVEEALALAFHLPREMISLRMDGMPLESLSSPETFARLINPTTLPDAHESLSLFAQETAVRTALPFNFSPYSEISAYPTEEAVSNWSVQRGGGGVRAQLLRHAGEVQLWIEATKTAEEGAECFTHRFPELVQAASCLPNGTVIEGELFPRFSVLKRTDKAKISSKMHQKYPVSFRAQDLLESAGEDIRSSPPTVRLTQLQAILPAASDSLLAPERIFVSTQEELLTLHTDGRNGDSPGLLLKHQTSGRVLRWPSTPFKLNAVLVYVETSYQGLSGCNFALWDEQELVPLARTSIKGLDPIQIQELETWVKANVRESFGPMRSVDPIQVFEIAFDEVETSTRHRAGLTLRAPRMVRWLKQKNAAQADSLNGLRNLVNK